MAVWYIDVLLSITAIEYVAHLDRVCSTIEISNNTSNDATDLIVLILSNKSNVQLLWIIHDEKNFFYCNFGIKKYFFEKFVESIRVVLKQHFRISNIPFNLSICWSGIVGIRSIGCKGVGSSDGDPSPTPRATPTQYWIPFQNAVSLCKVTKFCGRVSRHELVYCDILLSNLFRDNIWRTILQ